jgi:4-amino-4-deoxy-L-arabinose transferase-like glycosyltransferase
MNTPPSLRFGDVLQLSLVVALAATLRIGYLQVAADSGRAAPPFVVQSIAAKVEPAGDPEQRGKEPASEFDTLVHNLAEKQSFAAVAPLSDKEESTAHVAPGYYWLVAQLSRFEPSFGAMVRWAQCGLGALTAGCLFLFARRAFGNWLVAFLAGLLAAFHPFWIVNTAELSDGVLTTFLLAAVLLLGTRGSQSGGAFTSLLFGLGLAALAMVRAATLPFAFVGLIWFLYHCKNVRHGWFNAILAVLGFANGLAPWAVRNWNAFHEPVPVVSSAYLHFWIGNNASATGGPLDEAALRKTLLPDRLHSLLDESNQAKRYASLGRDAVQEIARDPGATVTRRWQAGLKFIVGDEWFPTRHISPELPADAAADAPAVPDWLATNLELCLQGSLLVLMALGLLGWRWSFAWKSNARLATLAFLWLPLPYILGHAESLSGPRLPWDALLICFSAYALACCLPAVAKSSEQQLRRDP